MLHLLTPVSFLQEKRSPNMAQYAALYDVLLRALTGKSRESKYKKEDIMAGAESAKDARLIHQVHMVCLLVGVCFVSIFFSSNRPN